MTRLPAEPLRLDRLIRGGAIYSVTGETYRSRSQSLLGVGAAFSVREDQIHSISSPDQNRPEC
jgi:hypothetical protein